jgi:hypothetical protein
MGGTHTPAKPNSTASRQSWSMSASLVSGLRAVCSMVAANRAWDSVIVVVLLLSGTSPLLP